MATEEPAGMADERRGLLTDTEREILRTDGADVSDKYYSVVVSRARNKIEQVADDLAALENHPTLADELREIVDPGGGDVPSVGMAVRCVSCGEWTPVSESGTESVVVACTCGKTYQLEPGEIETYDGYDRPDTDTEREEDETDD